MALLRRGKRNRKSAKRWPHQKLLLPFAALLLYHPVSIFVAYQWRPFASSARSASLERNLDAPPLVANATRTQLPEAAEKAPPPPRAGGGGPAPRRGPRQPAIPAPFAVDILSVASLRRLPLLHAQRRTLASHASVRNFFHVTEADDADPGCHANITLEQVTAVSDFCRKRAGQKLSPVFHFLKGQYARIAWLRKKADPGAWLCAQPRPAAGLVKAFRHYQAAGQPLPDYLLVVDDDTYYNMELFRREFAEADAGRATYHAGCLVRFPVQQLNFTFPFGGFGSVLSRGTLENLFRPIHCPGTKGPGPDGPGSGAAVGEAALCARLREDNAGELRHFADGMSLAELMHAYASADRYRDVARWTHGFCMHSDWVLGYFANYYNASEHVAEPYYAGVPHARIEAYKGSEIYRGPAGLCKNDPLHGGGGCRADTELCHRTSPEWMEEETARWREKAPERFRRGAVPGPY